MRIEVERGVFTVFLFAALIYLWVRLFGFSSV